jgi:FtsP/CotA-like multicopper oxidase with cupredoxin domain
MKRSILVLVCLTAAAAFAQQPPAEAPPKPVLEVVVPGCPSGAELVNPYEIEASGGGINTKLDVKMQNAVQVPIYVTDGTNYNCTMTTFDLRNYGYPNPNGSGFVYGFPGPTYRLRKAVGSTPGDSLNILLSNSLPWPGADKCNQGGAPCGGTNPPQWCSDTTAKMPDCFHGDNTTNLHFHGTHISPQSPQDYVLLELQPAGAPADSDAHASHGVKGLVQNKPFQYAVNPLPANQPEGTHWYHPHKHGSTALQVGNGMAGALIVEGPFDDWLNGQFPVPPKEKVMVVQQIHDLNFYLPNAATQFFASVPLINGQFIPNVTMYPGEIQRWRIIAGTMEASAQFTFDFDGPSGSSVAIKQIAMDGIQFANANYQSQPLVSYPSKTFNISPGNRVDFLVQAPTEPGLYRITYDVFGRVEGQGTRRIQKSGLGKGKAAPTRENVRAILEGIAAGAAQPALLSINVVACPEGTQCPVMTFPKTLPDLPSYLDNIDSVDGSQSLLFSLKGAPLAQPQTFAIGVSGGAPQQFRGDCAVLTEPLGRSEEWTLTQDQDSGIGTPFHVFHIHTNQFQVLQNGVDANGKPVTYDPPIWMDSITLPDVGGKVVMRTHFEDYTGLYVLHCHFLGHEDRGMMLSVQAVCPDTKQYGTTVANGGPDNCAVPIAALKPCPILPPAPKAAATEAAPPPVRKRIKKN